jgi:cytochrome c peroxidase
MARASFAWCLGSSLVFAVLLNACEDKKDSAKPMAPAAPVAAPLAANTASAESAPTIDKTLLVQFAALPKDFASAANPMSKDKVELGRMLYHDVRLSKNQDLSCNSCHDLAKFGMDGLKTSVGHKKQASKRNAQTVLNAAGHFVQYWDGRAKDVEEQAKDQLLSPSVMAMSNEAAVLKVLASVPGYVEAFKKAFPADAKSLSFDNVAKAIGAFERTLAVPARFDRYVAGEDDAITNEEKRGLAKYLDLNCTSCHNGAMWGGTEYKKTGLVKPWPNQTDLGRFEVTKSESDKMMFKTPTLRNVAKTAPYFHDGSSATLEESVKLMAKHQLGKDISDEEAQSVASFLGTLTGEPTAEMMRVPVLPNSSATTPKPDPK